MDTSKLTLRELTTELTLRDEQLIDNEMMFRGIFCVNPIPMSLTSLNDGTYIKVNQAFCDVSGYTESEIIGKTVIDMGFYNDINDREKMISKLKEKGFLKNYPISFKTKGGHVFESVIFIKYINVKNVPHIIAVIVIKDEIC